ncbi:MAG TPA: hypothetical protein PK280_18890 [Planctomycetota bacterium]|nr:hypothetical protein [Planctomycetota bacterium]
MKTLRMIASLLLGISLAAIAGEPAAPAAPPAFTKKPTATKAGDKVTVEFAVDRETDVAVFIEDGAGKVVRHLVAGVLGKNPPPPLKPGLAQSVEWDGKADYGRPAPGVPLKVRVALALGARYDKAVLSDPQSLGGISGLVAAPDGTVYVMHGTGTALGGGGATVKAFDREGSYLRTVMPFPANLTAEQAKAFATIEVNGRPCPLVQKLNGNNGEGSPPCAPIGAASARKAQMGVTPDGVILMLLPSGHLGAVEGRSGLAAWGSFKGAALPNGPRTFPCVAASPDGKSAYIAGLGKPVVHRVKLPERTPAEVFFGEAAKAGGDDAHLGAAGPAGLAVDGKGNLLISDPANRRILVVAEADGKPAGSMPVEGPGTLAVDRESGAVYVLASGKGAPALVKFSGWKEPKELSRVAITNPWGNGTCVMTADFSKKPAVIWVGTDGGRLYRIEDSGDKFGAPKDVNSGSLGNAAFNDITVDRFRPDREIYARASEGGNWYFRFNEESGKAEKLTLRAGGAAHSGLNVMPAPDGNIYSLRWPYSFYKHDRTGKQLDWEEPRRADVTIPESGGKKFVWPPNNSYVPVSMTDQPHTLGVRGSDGHIFTMEPAAPGDRPPKMVREYLPTGKLVSETPLVWKVSDAALGPRFDAAGNVYVADVVRPAGWVYPPEFDQAFPAKVELNKTRPTGAQDAVANGYGSIVKFSPKGGIIDVKGWKNPFPGEFKADPAFKETAVVWYEARQLRGPEKVVGAEWVHPGISQVFLARCNCESTSFDVDEFGRVFFPDTFLYQVRVIDTAGNALTTIGGYGNADSCGPESKDKALAVPEIALGWLVGVGVTDRYAYMGDSMNRRLLRAKLVYAAEESCEVK